MATTPRPLRPLTRILTVMLAIELLSWPVALVATRTLLHHLDCMPQAAVGPYTALRPAFSQGWPDAWKALPFVSSLAAAVAYLAWLYRAACLARWRQPDRMRMSPGALVTWSLVPVASLFMPMIGILQIRRALAPHRGPVAVLWIWWLLDTGAAVYGWIPQWFMQRATDAASLAHALRLQTWSAVAGPLTTILLMMWTRRLTAAIADPARAEGARCPASP